MMTKSAIFTEAHRRARSAMELQAKRLILKGHRYFRSYREQFADALRGVHLEIAREKPPVASAGVIMSYAYPMNTVGTND
jgi:hypothetical protein